MRWLDVTQFGASGRKTDDARLAIQGAVDACAENGGGVVYLPPGEYTSGTIHLRSHVRFHIEAGATLYSSRNRSDYDTPEDRRASLFYGEDLQNVTLEGRGVVDGQAEYEWRLADLDDRYIKENLDELLKAGRQPLRAFPRKDCHGRLVLLHRCTDVRIEGLSFARSPSWTIHLYGCKRVVIDGIYIRTSLREGVWAGGIGPDGCGDVRISNCTIETGDDAIAFHSTSTWGPALPCENITVTNCRLSSASSAIAFCDGNENCVRNVTIDNCVITDSNRGIAFMTFDGGYVSDVVISGCTIDCRRFDWFWRGDGDPLYFMSRRRYSELHPELGRTDAAAGSIRNVSIRDIVARGAGRCLLRGHPERWLEGIRLDNVRLSLAADPEAAYNKEGSGLTIRYARDIALRNVEVSLGDPSPARWKSPLSLEDAVDVLVEGFRGRVPAGSAEPGIALKNASGIVIRNSRVDPRGATLLVAGVGTKDIVVGTGVIPPGGRVEDEALPGATDEPPRRIDIQQGTGRKAARLRKPASKGREAAKRKSSKKTAPKPHGKQPARAAQRSSGTGKKRR
ncbi:MAG TPA: glycosyl hydrolase family 28 protein [Spirochaetia bacterium]|nr:glycosyl hydrolase family 28 protein [Spirochaetia bacterium]